MTKKYRLKVEQLGIPAGVEFILDNEKDSYSNSAQSVIQVCLPRYVVTQQPDLFEPVSERWKPEKQEGIDYFQVSCDGKVKKEEDFYTDYDDDCFDFGNCFQTEEQAEEAARRIKDVLMKYHAELAEEAQA